MIQNVSPRDLVSRAHHELFTDRDVGALERYFAPHFIEHSPLVKDGLAGLRDLVWAHPELRHETYRVLQDGDLVAIHGRFNGIRRLAVGRFRSVPGCRRLNRRTLGRPGAAGGTQRQWPDSVRRPD
ncbi:nuclear transport factor 2 family protein [Photorhabdus akhurstii]|uniref:nuclear transport factor 2 family protein n=1 Tax=Photorhabdus akhurstii TaxID=171438 RepID=UPI001FE5F4FF|nr:nuclear transport factor 2 family protein [Photorhabdus akhurstii]